MTSAAGWWQRRVVVGSAMLIATLPMWFVSTPPLIDLVGHMGRYHIQLSLADTPLLQKNWAFQWHWIGNLGVDLLMEALGRILGIEHGAWLVAAALPPIMIWGQVRLARAVHGHLPPTALAAFPFALAYPWQYGLVNYWLGVGLALHAAASWIQRPPRRFAGVWLTLLSIGLWTAHIYSWAVFSVLVGACTLSAPQDRRRDRMLALWPLAAPAVIMAVQGYGAQPSDAETLGWFVWRFKFAALIETLRDQSRLLDVTSLALAATLIFAGLRSSVVRLDRGLALAALVLLVLIAIIPFQLLGSAYADGRLWPVFFMVALLALDTDRRWIAVAAAAIFTVRIVFMAVGFSDYDRDYARHLRALDQVHRGASVAILTEFPCEVSWRRPRLDHIDGMAIVRRDAFTNGQWEVPGAQLLTPLGARGTQYNADPSQLVRLRGCPVDLRPELAKRIALLPKERFDYVWVIGFDPASLPRYDDLIPIYLDDKTILYRITRQMSFKSPPRQRSSDGAARSLREG